MNQCCLPYVDELRDANVARSFFIEKLDEEREFNKKLLGQIHNLERIIRDKNLSIDELGHRNKDLKAQVKGFLKMLQDNIPEEEF